MKLGSNALASLPGANNKRNSIVLCYVTTLQSGKVFTAMTLILQPLIRDYKHKVYYVDMAIAKKLKQTFVTILRVIPFLQDDTKNPDHSDTKIMADPARFEQEPFESREVNL
ncbi:hypothetical protein HHI36_017034 [Cryptolaemus montrouzieri]|uniref:Uncharacterized protein n=1 Tax=Cryptolaemus montrouzieri TaxID=559131 RepID=A0ABD2NLR2_9CUCU